MSDRKVKVVGKHVRGCFTMRGRRAGEWPSHWGPLAYGEHGDPVVKTERRYGKNGRKFIHWVRFICNDTSCMAELHVASDFILSAAKTHMTFTGLVGCSEAARAVASVMDVLESLKTNAAPQAGKARAMDSTTKDSQ
jgi:hypothetical protein